MNNASRITLKLVITRRMNEKTTVVSKFGSKFSVFLFIRGEKLFFDPPGEKNGFFSSLKITRGRVTSRITRVYAPMVRKIMFFSLLSVQFDKQQLQAVS